MAMACWQPLIVVTGAREGPMYLLSLVQFPLFATLFTLGIYRWPALRVGAGAGGGLLGIGGMGGVGGQPRFTMRRPLNGGVWKDRPS